MTFYDRTKEDSRPWRADQDTRGQAKDDAAELRADAIQAQTQAHGAPEEPEEPEQPEEPTEE